MGKGRFSAGEATVQYKFKIHGRTPRNDTTPRLCLATLVRKEAANAPPRAPARARSQLCLECPAEEVRIPKMKMIMRRNAEERRGTSWVSSHKRRTAAEAEAVMHLVECWETRGKMEEDERETGKMISGVPPPLAPSLGRRSSEGRKGGMQCNIMEEQCNRWRGGQKFFLTVLRALIGGREGGREGGNREG